MTMSSRLVACFLSLLFAVSAVIVPTPSAAQGDATVEIARQRFKEGVGFYDQRQYDKARLAFLQAYALKPHPSVLLNLAQSELRAGYPADAANHFALYQRENPDASEGEKQEAELGFAAARSKVGEVQLSVNADGATILVDGEEKGKSPIGGPLYVMPGAHTIEAKFGDQSGSAQVDVGAGQSTSATITLGGDAPTAAPATAPTAAPASDPSMGDDGADEGFEVSTKGKRKPFPKWFVDNKLAWIPAGIGIIGLATGTVFAFGAKSDYDSADDLRNQIITQRDRDAAAGTIGSGEAPCNPSTAARAALGAEQTQGGQSLLDLYQDACIKYNDKVDTADNKKTFAIVGLAVGGAGIVGTFVYYFMDPKARQSEDASIRVGPVRARFEPLTGPNVSGMSVVGRF